MHGPEKARDKAAGRRTGDSGTRELILDTARDMFAHNGYDATTVRGIARAADVDPALIRHFFGDKLSLFASTMASRSTVPQRMLAAFPGPLEGLGERLTRTYLELWADPETGPVLIGLVRSAMTSSVGLDLFVEAVGGKIQEIADIPDGFDFHAPTLAVSQLFGLAMARYVLRLPALVDMPLDAVVADVAPNIQRLLGNEATLNAFTELAQQAALLQQPAQPHN